MVAQAAVFGVVHGGIFVWSFRRRRRWRKMRRLDKEKMNHNSPHLALCKPEGMRGASTLNMCRCCCFTVFLWLVLPGGEPARHLCVLHGGGGEAASRQGRRCHRRGHLRDGPEPWGVLGAVLRGRFVVRGRGEGHQSQVRRVPSCLTKYHRVWLSWMFTPRLAQGRISQVFGAQVYGMM